MNELTPEQYRKELRVSPLVAALTTQVRQVGLPPPMFEVEFDTHRKWRFDMCWPEKRLAVECDGGTHTAGRHTRGQGYRDDCIKINHATISGWRVLRVTADMINDGMAILQIQNAYQPGTVPIILSSLVKIRRTRCNG